MITCWSRMNVFENVVLSLFWLIYNAHRFYTVQSRFDTYWLFYQGLVLAVVNDKLSGYIVMSLFFRKHWQMNPINLLALMEVLLKKKWPLIQKPQWLISLFWNKINLKRIKTCIYHNIMCFAFGFRKDVNYIRGCLFNT
jgi:hypothetical protein